MAASGRGGGLAAALASRGKRTRHLRDAARSTAHGRIVARRQQYPQSSISRTCFSCFRAHGTARAAPKANVADRSRAIRSERKVAAGEDAQARPRRQKRPGRSFRSGASPDRPSAQCERPPWQLARGHGLRRQHRELGFDHGDVGLVLALRSASSARWRAQGTGLVQVGGTDGRVGQDRDAAGLHFRMPPATKMFSSPWSARTILTVPGRAKSAGCGRAGCPAHRFARQHHELRLTGEDRFLCADDIHMQGSHIGSLLLSWPSRRPRRSNRPCRKPARAARRTRRSRSS